MKKMSEHGRPTLDSVRNEEAATERQEREALVKRNQELEGMVRGLMAFHQELADRAGFYTGEAISADRLVARLGGKPKPPKGELTEEEKAFYKLIGQLLTEGAIIGDKERGRLVAQFEAVVEVLKASARQDANS